MPNSGGDGPMAGMNSSSRTSSIGTNSPLRPGGDGSLTVRVAVGAMAEELAEATAPAEASISQQVMETGRPLMIPDLSENGSSALVSSQMSSSPPRNRLVATTMPSSSPRAPCSLGAANSSCR